MFASLPRMTFRMITVRLVAAALALALGGCGLAEPGRPDVPAAATSAVPSPGVPANVAACDAARALDPAGATSDDYAALGVIVSKAPDDDLAEAGIELVRVAAGGVGARSSFYARYLDVMAQCLRFPA